jgi:WD40 repeat protein
MKVAFADPQDVVVASDMTGSVRSWNARHGRSQLLRAAQPGQRGGLSQLVVNGPAGWVAMVDYESGRLTVRNLTTGIDLTPADAPAFARLALSEDGTRLVGLSRDGKLILFDMTTLRIRSIAGLGCQLADDDMPGDPFGNPDFVLSANGADLVAINGKGRAAWLAPQTGCVKRRKDLGEARNYSAVVINLRAGLVALSDYRDIIVRRLDGAGVPIRLPSSDAMRQMTFTPDGGALLTAESDGAVHKYLLQTGTSQAWSYDGGATSLAVSSDGRFAVGLFTGDIVVNNPQDGSSRQLTGATLQVLQLERIAEGLLVRTSGGIKLLNPDRGDFQQIAKSSEDTLLQISPGSGLILRISKAGGDTMRVSDGARSAVESGIPFRNSISALSPDGQSIALSVGEEMRLYNVPSGSFIVLGRLSHPATSLAFSPDGHWLIASGEAATLQLFDLVARRSLSLAQGLGMAAFSFSDDAQALALGGEDGAVRVVLLSELSTTQVLPASSESRVTSLAFSPDADRLAIGHGGGKVEVFPLKPGAKPVVIEPLNGDTTSLAFVDGNVLAGSGANGEIKFWYGSSALASLFLTREGGIITASGDGRFESTELDRPGAIAWVMPDNPLRPLAPEIFMRDFLEPRLLQRLIACHRTISLRPDACKTTFRPVPDLSQLNRVQPEVRITGVRPGKTSATAIVTVEVRRGRDDSQPKGRQDTGAYDVHLLRDGQLVARWPKLSSLPMNNEAWRTATQAAAADDNTWTRRDVAVRVPRRGPDDPVVFSAYAFNEDRVKSESADGRPYPAPRPSNVLRPKAYVITVGVNAYQDPQRNLAFAARDAEAMANALKSIDGYDVVPIALISDSQSNWTATKPILAAVLDRLAGRRTSVSLNRVAYASELATATPDDLVIMTFSGHGHAEPDGRFFLLAADSGPIEVNTPEGGLPAAALRRFISTDELAAWIAAIDAGQMVLIIDACHSAASVAQPGFKPGPMGDRGLGQLAYDKGLQVLAASQADDVALESAKVRQGLLTFALVAEGLALEPSGKRRADKDRDGRLTITEWLRFAEQRTPGLYDDIRKGRLNAVYAGASDEFKGRNTGTSSAFQEAVVGRAQTPSLYDFKRRTDDVVLP